MGAFKESEARQKWCPMVRMAILDVTSDDQGFETQQVVGGCNTGGFGEERFPHQARCIASDCMMWEQGGLGLGDCGLKRQERD